MALEIGELITKIVKEIAKNSVYTKMESKYNYFNVNVTSFLVDFY
jgi:hypothetical protein